MHCLGDCTQDVVYEESALLQVQANFGYHLHSWNPALTCNSFVSGLTYCQLKHAVRSDCLSSPSTHSLNPAQLFLSPITNRGHSSNGKSQRRQFPYWIWGCSARRPRAHIQQVGKKSIDTCFQKIYVLLLNLHVILMIRLTNEHEFRKSSRVTFRRSIRK